MPGPVTVPREGDTITVKGGRGVWVWGVGGRAAGGGVVGVGGSRESRFDTTQQAHVPKVLGEDGESAARW